MRLATALFLAIAPAALAQDVTITAPASVRVGGNGFVVVTGLTKDELAQCFVGIQPPEPFAVMSVPIGYDEGTKHATFLIAVMEGVVPGHRKFQVSRNPWRKPLDEAVALAQSGLADEDAKALVALANDLATRYPYRLAEAVLEVTGPRPPPLDPDNPNPPEPPSPNDPSPSPKPVTRVTYVYEKDQNNPPRPVSLALQRLNAGGSVVATEFEEDTVNAVGRTPAQYAIALEAAQKAGLPALVVQAGEAVLRVVKAPTTEAQVMEAAK